MVFRLHHYILMLRSPSQRNSTPSIIHISLHESAHNIDDHMPCVVPITYVLQDNESPKENPSENGEATSSKNECDNQSQNDEICTGSQEDSGEHSPRHSSTHVGLEARHLEVYSPALPLASPSRTELCTPFRVARGDHAPSRQRSDAPTSPRLSLLATRCPSPQSAGSHVPSAATTSSSGFFVVAAGGENSAANSKSDENDEI
jgi:hypothetical protein